MRVFLQAKSWQMFLLIFVPMILPTFMAPLSSGLLVFQVTTIAWMFIVVGWLYSVGIAANNKVPDELRRNPTLYRFGLMFAIIYMCAVQFFFIGSLEAGKPPEPPAWLIPAHLLSMFFLFYGLLFTAKQFTTCEQQKNAKFLEHSGPFFLFWFCPLGVWFLQPKINDLFANKNA